MFLGLAIQTDRKRQYPITLIFGALKKYSDHPVLPGSMLWGDGVWGMQLARS